MPQPMETEPVNKRLRMGGQAMGASTQPMFPGGEFHQPMQQQHMMPQPILMEIGGMMGQQSYTQQQMFPGQPIQPSMPTQQQQQMSMMAGPQQFQHQGMGMLPNQQMMMRTQMAPTYQHPQGMMQQGISRSKFAPGFKYYFIFTIILGPADMIIGQPGIHPQQMQGMPLGPNPPPYGMMPGQQQQQQQPWNRY
uniref:VrrA protein n=1 Tax=Heterorhabditis bacteriophora TaxID=37862 RepID=A0A1I7X6I4_HETBA